MTFTGIGFPVSGYTAHASFNSVNATSVQIMSDTEVQAYFSSYGVAATTGIPELYF